MDFVSIYISEGDLCPVVDDVYYKRAVGRGTAESKILKLKNNKVQAASPHIALLR